MPQFEVQTVDPESGVEAWTPVVAATADDARDAAMQTGMVVGAIRLKSLDEPTAQSVPDAAMLAAASRGAICPTCLAPTYPAGRGMYSTSEQLTCLILVLCGLIPGVIYYVATESKPFCTKCRRRV